MKILVTAGPTREYIDCVRFITNASTGTLGFTIAEEAASLGHTVTLIHGPVDLAPPAGVQSHAVTTAAEMLQAIQQHVANASMLIMTAAVADYRPKHPHTGKMKKTVRPLLLELEPTADILAILAQHKGNRIHVGFSMETDKHRAYALDKMKKKDLDYIVTNAPGNLGPHFEKAEMIARDGTIMVFRHMHKQVFAKKLLEALLAAQNTDKHLPVS